MAVIDGWTEEQALALAAAIEGDSEHPIAPGIRRKAEERHATVTHVSDFEAMKGRGIKATYQGHHVFAGGPRLLEFLNLSLPENLAHFAANADAKGQTVVFLIQGNQPVAALTLADAIRPESKVAVLPSITLTVLSS